MRQIDLEHERDFENRKSRDSELRAPQSKYYWAAGLAIDAHRAETLERIAGKRVLEIGCSTGIEARDYSRAAGAYLGVDISDEAIARARARNLPGAVFLCIDGHSVPREGGSFDCVIVNSLLHHLDLEVSLREIHRLLAEDGVLIFKEPLGTNPAFRLYRWLTPRARTVDERPFTVADLRLMRRYFALSGLRWFGFLSVVSAFARSGRLRSALTRCDDALARTPLRYVYWQVCGCAQKRVLARA